MSPIYLDNNATTAIAPEVLEAMMPFLTSLYGNPSSPHSFGGNLAYKLETAREQVASLINAEPQEVIFTSCGTESNNTAIMSALELNPHKKHIITTSVEHPSVINCVKNCELKGYTATYLPVDKYGILDLNEFKKCIDNDVALVSVMYANNETGVLFPVKEIGMICKDRNVPFHVDAVQAAGKIKIDVSEIGADMLSISGHKLHAPKGIGALYIKKSFKFKPYLFGGHQEYGRRGGTENLASIIALGKACDICINNLESDQKRIGLLRDKLEFELIKIADAFIIGKETDRVKNTTSISFSNIDSSDLLVKLDKHGICASAGSACSSKISTPSHVLQAMKVPEHAIKGSIRFSLSKYTTEEEISIVINLLPAIIDELRGSVRTKR